MIVNTTPSDMQYFTSEQLNAPQMMGGSNGDMLNVLDACLLNGWGQQQALSATLADGQVTITFGVSHGFLQNQRISVTGFTESNLDGVYRIKSLTPNSVTINTPSATSADGTITAKLTPLDWQSLFGKTDPLKRAYRSKKSGVQRVLFLDMSYPNPADYNATAPAKRAMVTVCEDMQVLGVPIGDMTNNINNKPTNANGSLFWYQKRGSTNTSITYATAKEAVPSNASKWRLVGNGEVFYFIVGWAGASTADNEIVFDAFGFGKFSDLTDGVESDTFLSAAKNDNDKLVGGSNPYYPGSLGSGVNATIYTFDISGITQESIRAPLRTVNSYSGSQVPYPNRYGNAVFATPYRIYTDRELRGLLYAFMFLDSAVDAKTYDSRVLDNLLIIPLQPAVSRDPTSACAVAFYVGD